MATAIPSGTPDETSAPSNTGNPNEVGHDSFMNEIPTSYTNKLSPTSLTKDNFWKLDATMHNDADYDVWLALASVHEFSSTEVVDSVLRDGPWMILWVKFHDVSLVAYISDAYTSDDLSFIATKIGTLMMLDSYMKSMCLESWGRSNYARILIEIDACDDFRDIRVTAVPNFEGTRYTKEIIHVEYEWKPPRCSACLIFDHSLNDYQKAPKRVVK
ncbi:hypothetical protein Tco_0236053 [Tanacetum coccineum]